MSSQIHGALPGTSGESLPQQTGVGPEGGRDSHDDHGGYLDKLLPDDEENNIGFERVQTEPTRPREIAGQQWRVPRFKLTTRPTF